MFFFVGVVAGVGVFGFEKALGLFGVGVASVALVDSLEDVYVLDELFDVIFLFFFEGSLFVVVEHEQRVFEADGDDLLLVARVLCFFVRFFSKINKSIDEAYINFLELLAEIEEDEPVQKSNRPAHSRVQHIFDTILRPES